MENQLISNEIKKLSIAERILIIEDIWDSIVDEQANIDLSEAQRNELDRRLETYSISPEQGTSWENLKRNILFY